jgi:hypothetical protein
MYVYTEYIAICRPSLYDHLFNSNSNLISSAQGFIAKVKIPSEIVSTVQLSWNRYKTKKSADFYPVRIGFKDEIKGLNLPQDFDETKKHAIEYLSCIKGSTGKRAVVTNSQLLPYGESHVWNPNLMKKYLEMLKKDDKNTELELRKEELYLHKILKVAGERETRQEEENANANATAKEPLQTLVVADFLVETETDVATTRAQLDLLPTTVAAASLSDVHKKDSLKAGDAIEYYQTISKAGDKDALTQAVILSVQPGNNNNQHPLRLHNNEILPCHHSVKRIFTRTTRQRGGRQRQYQYLDLRDTATYRPIRSYKLPRSELKENDPLREQLESNNPMAVIMDRNLAKFEKKVKEDGCEVFLDMVTLKSKRKNKNNNEEEEANKPAKRTKVVTATGPSEDTTETTPADNQETSDTTDETVKKLQAQLAKIRAQTGRRRIAGAHMTEGMVKLAIQVHQQFFEKQQHYLSGWGVKALAKQLQLTDYGLEQFLEGDECKMIRLAQHEETEKVLQSWVKDNDFARTSL